MKRILLPLALLSFALAPGCRNDPVEQAIIDALPKDTTPNGPLHRGGQPCLVCHDSYGGATPLAIGGTVYALDPTMKKILPASQIRVTIVDSNSGDSRNVCSNAAGNFFIESWSDLTFPLTPTAGGVTMQSLVGRDGSCATCHALPNAQSLDPVTGAGPDSAGVILVSPTSADPTCPTTP
jgi:mono/diheme cytochrome c family protein